MNTKNLLKRIAVRAVAFLVLAGLSMSVIFYALGYFELPYINRPGSDTEPETTIDLGPIESSLKNLESGDTVSGIGTDTSAILSTETGGSQTVQTGTGSSDTDGDTQAPPYNPNLKSTAELLSEGYGVSYADWDSAMMLASLELGCVVSPSMLTGNTKDVPTVQRMRYEDGGVEFKRIVTETRYRHAIELYMGYVIVDSGLGDATYPFKDGQTHEPLANVLTLSIFSSTGNLIAVFPAEYITPAYTRDASDRPLFIYKEQYYYLDEKNACLVLSDYVDERDNRGLYFDYNPDYGKSDNNINKYSNYEEISLNYFIDTYYRYARFAIDWRIALELYIADPDYADYVAQRDGNGNYFNRTFYEMLRIAKIQIQNDPSITAETTVVTDPVEDPVDSSAVDSSALDSSAISSSALDSSAIDSSGINSSAVESSAINSTSVYSSALIYSEADSSAIESSAIDSSGVDSSSINSSSIDSSALDSSGIDSSAIDSSAVDSSGIDSSAIDSSAVDSSGIETQPAETTTEETAPAEEPHKTIDVTKKYNAYRFIFATKQPAVNNNYNSTRNSNISVYIYQTISWKSQYKYAKAFNFSENRAVTFDDNGKMKVINKNSGTVYEFNKSIWNDVFALYTNQYYTEPFYKDLSSIGHYYYDEGLLRTRFVEIASYNPHVFLTDYDVLLDTNGNTYELPKGFSLYAYSEGILILERDGLYGCYHKDGYWIAQPVYTHAEPFIEGLCVLTLSDGTCGMIDKNGTVVLPFRFSEITNASSGVIAAYAKDGGWYVFTKMKK